VSTFKTLNSIEFVAYLQRELGELGVGAIAISNDIAWRWRYGGAVPTYEDFVRTFSNGVLVQFIITDIHTGRLVGLAATYSFNPQYRTAYIAAMIAPEFLMTGVGIDGIRTFIRYVMKVWDLHKIYMEVPEFNFDQFSAGIGSIFLLEGTLREDIYLATRRWDKLICAIYRSEFMTKWG